MRQFALLGLAILLFSNALVLAQDDAAPDGDDAAAADGDDAAADGDAAAADECEEAWDYVEFMKLSIKEKIESILQETLFEPRPLLEETVTKTMEQVLEIRDDILTRTKAIRNKDEAVKICPEQNIKQEEFLTQIRMQVMGVLLQLIEKDAASAGKLQDVGKLLLAIRTRVNSEITRMIMLRESSGPIRTKADGDCDCGILDTIVTGLDQVVNKDAAVVEEGDEGDDDAAAPADGDAAAGDAAAGAGENPSQALIMILMDVDAEIRALYNEILAELDDTAREALGKELLSLKDISADLHEALSKLTELDPEKEKEAIDRLIRRDIRGILSDVKRDLETCQSRCPGECDSCGAKKIDDVSEKMKDYKATLDNSEDESDARESIRADLMAFLTQTNSDMTELLKTKAEDGELDDCGTEELEVIDKIKGPLWMMVNITIFGDGGTVGDMIDALEQALVDMRSQYCGPSNATTDRIIDDNECDLNEINMARDWITDIDVIIAEDIFKSEDDTNRRNAMLGLIELKSSMDDRVRELFQDNLSCKEEVEQIKNIYAQKLTECLTEMMNPRFRFDLLGRSERVQCVKDLRIQLEDRRGVLLMREIEARINEAGTGAQEAA